MGSTQANLPTLIVWLQALSVPVIGAVAAWIAYQQWRTASRKVQIDLFDKRLAIYEAARDAIQPIIAAGNATDDNIAAYCAAIDRAPFLFGPEVVDQFEETRMHIATLMMHTGRMSSGPPYEQSAIEGRGEYFLKVASFYTVLPKLLEPYIRLDHRYSSGSWFTFRPYRKSRRTGSPS